MMTFTPNELPTAKLGSYYYTEVDIGGGPGPVVPRSFRYTIIPSDSGITLVPNKSETFPYNNLKIQGVPKAMEPIVLTIRGFIYGTSRVGQSFEKIYTIKVSE